MIRILRLLSATALTATLAYPTLAQPPADNHPLTLGASPAPDVTKAHAPLEMTYFGAAGWRMTDGETIVLLDPWPSRIPYGGAAHPDDKRPSYSRTDPAPVDTDLIDQLIPEADFILVQHGHFDHLGDVPYIAKKTGAKVIGTETVVMILRAYGVPEEQLYAVQGGEDYQFGNFSVRVVPGLHSALDQKHYHDSRRYDRDTVLEAPLRIEQFIEGGALSFLARLGGRSILTMGSMNFIEREFEGLEPDILLAGINGSRMGLYDYDRRLLQSTGYPAIVIPTHWDNFRLPYSFSQKDNVERKLLPFAETAKQVSPNSKVIIPVHLEPITLP
ncbi:MAG: L-ascorbate metabolism protein UlaG (beta-lactamase superfamily) [Glaciecola sp.]|jgi:L-ascorbate metabolism protein UlaG (beta-lactamase superfamily)|uniref:MBL fold metallo-hydrolase n=1 Tax=Congregibacter sp. TaxID=2744308 RepID=UPI0039E700FB